MKSHPSQLIPKSLGRRKNNLGLTLIELLVSMTIGLILMLAVIGAYIGASGAGRTAEAIGRMNEDGQQALIILSQQLRMAGANPSQPDRSTSTFDPPAIAPTATLTARGHTMPLHNYINNAYAVRGCDDRFSNITSPAATSTSALTCWHAATSTGPDSISIAYEADRFNTVPTGAGVPTDCVGSGITESSFTYTKSDEATTATAKVYEAENRFYIGTSTAISNPSLYCKGTGGTQPLVENIENLQFRYGVVNPANPSVTYATVTPTFTTTLVLGYLTAHGVDTDGTLTGAAGSSERWNAVKTVRICVVVRSENEVLDSLASARYLDCNDTLVTTPPDRRLRRAFSTTVVLRNQ
jgi:type IV pilus assembly protein PilW